ncbi:MAG: hypothetical protein ISQ32_04850, partial [Rickettsiales bacterium]|nr:hypothetical protein [Rickettsiales bacterium]
MKELIRKSFEEYNTYYRNFVELIETLKKNLENTLKANQSLEGSKNGVEIQPLQDILNHFLDSNPTLPEYFKRKIWGLTGESVNIVQLSTFTIELNELKNFSKHLEKTSQHIKDSGARSIAQLPLSIKNIEDIISYLQQSDKTQIIDYKNNQLKASHNINLKQNFALEFLKNFILKNDIPELSEPVISTNLLEMTKAKLLQDTSILETEINKQKDQTLSLISNFKIPRNHKSISKDSLQTSTKAKPHHETSIFENAINAKKDQTLSSISNFKMPRNHKSISQDSLQTLERQFTKKVTEVSSCTSEINQTQVLTECLSFLSENNQAIVIDLNISQDNIETYSKLFDYYAYSMNFCDRYIYDSSHHPSKQLVDLKNLEKQKTSLQKIVCFLAAAMIQNTEIFEKYCEAQLKSQSEISIKTPILFLYDFWLKTKEDYYFNITQEYGFFIAGNKPQKKEQYKQLSNIFKLIIEILTNDPNKTFPLDVSFKADKLIINHLKIQNLLAKNPPDIIRDILLFIDADNYYNLNNNILTTEIDVKDEAIIQSLKYLNAADNNLNRTNLKTSILSNRAVIKTQKQVVENLTRNFLDNIPPKDKTDKISEKLIKYFQGTNTGAFFTKTDDSNIAGLTSLLQTFREKEDEKKLADIDYDNALKKITSLEKLNLFDILLSRVPNYEKNIESFWNNLKVFLFFDIKDTAKQQLITLHNISDEVASNENIKDFLIDLGSKIRINLNQSLAEPLFEIYAQIYALQKGRSQKALESASFKANSITSWTDETDSELQTLTSDPREQHDVQKIIPVSGNQTLETAPLLNKIRPDKQPFLNIINNLLKRSEDKQTLLNVVAKLMFYYLRPSETMKSNESNEYFLISNRICQNSYIKFLGLNSIPEFLIYKTSSFLDDIKQNSDEQDLYNQIFKNAGAESNSHSHYFRTF